MPSSEFQEHLHTCAHTCIKHVNEKQNLDSLVGNLESLVGKKALVAKPDSLSLIP